MNTKNISITVWLILIISLWLNLFFLKEHFSTKKINNNIVVDNIDVNQSNTWQVVVWTWKTSFSLDYILSSDQVDFREEFKNIEEEVNTYDIILSSLRWINTLSDYIDLLDEYSDDLIQLVVFKNRDIELYKKYWSIKFDKYLEEKDEDILEYISKNWGDVNKAKQEILNLILNNFSNVSTMTSELTEEELQVDLNVYFNSLDLEKALLNCDKIKWIKLYYDDVNICKNKIYFYRANNKNKFCENIVENDFMKKVCEDSLIN